jgi:histidine kinase-like protein
MDVLSISVTPDPLELRRMRWSLQAWLEELCVRDVEGAVLAVNETVENGIRVSGNSRCIRVCACVSGTSVLVGIADPVPWDDEESRSGRWLEVVRAVTSEMSVTTGEGTDVRLAFEDAGLPVGFWV